MLKYITTYKNKCILYNVYYYNNMNIILYADIPWYFYLEYFINKVPIAYKVKLSK